MPPRKKEPTGPVPVEAFKHDDKRVNNPTADSGELMSPDVAQPKQLRYPRNPDLDPQLVWAGKDEQDGEDLVVDAPPIYIQEKIAPQVIIENLRKVVEKPELTLFDDFDGLEGYEAVEYYKHEANWSNRMILGDSLQVMASLAEKENLRGKVQMIYIDPPYGIKFGSNWQTKTDSRDVRDAKAEDVTREVEQIKAFRDTWEEGINSYLTYLRDRFTIGRDLLTDSGSIFVQIGDENVHLVRSLLDEVFGRENFAAQILFYKTSSESTLAIPGVVDTILVYAKIIEQLKSRPLRIPKKAGDRGAKQYTKLISSDMSQMINMTQDQISGAANIPDGWEICCLGPLTSMGAQENRSKPYIFEGQKVSCPANRHWSYDPSPGAEMDRLARLGRIRRSGISVRSVLMFRDNPMSDLDNVWLDTGTGSFTEDQTYVVQTANKVIQRCVLMATDPGDLVLDPTCGSGTTAFVAEQWGRRWITIDTSRVALALARQRIMAAKFPYYTLADPNGDVRKAFRYKEVPHVTLKSIATNPDIRPEMSQREIHAVIARHAETETLYDHPEEDQGDPQSRFGCSVTRRRELA